MKGFKFTGWKLPHYVTIVGTAVGVALVNYIATVPVTELLSDIGTKAGLDSLVRGALCAALAAIIGVAKTNPPSA